MVYNKGVRVTISRILQNMWSTIPIVRVTIPIVRVTITIVRVTILIVKVTISIEANNVRCTTK